MNSYYSQYRWINIAIVVKKLFLNDPTPAPLRAKNHHLLVAPPPFTGMYLLELSSLSFVPLVLDKF
jgi:hypothetical protein